MARTPFAVALLVAAAGVGSPAAAQLPTRAAPFPNPRGLFVGGALNGTAIKSDSVTAGDIEWGGGFSLLLGWGFTRHIAVIADLTRTDVEDAITTHIDLGLRAHFPSDSGHGFVPYLELGVSRRQVVARSFVVVYPPGPGPRGDGSGTLVEGDLESAGAGLALGGGFQYFLAPTASIALGVKGGFGSFTRTRFQGRPQPYPDMEVKTVRANLGVIWYPIARR